MMIPLKYKAVNWIDGMKISSNHFVNTDNFIQDIARDANSLHLNNNNFGLLPPFQGERTSLEMEIVARASNHLQVKIVQCNAVTAEGYRINIPKRSLEEALVFDHYFSQDSKNSMSETYYIMLLVNPFEREPTGVPNPDESPLRYPFVDKKYSIAILPAAELNMQNSSYLEIGKVIRTDANIQIVSNYIPPCTCIISHPLLINYYETFSSNLNELQLLSFRIIDKVTQRENVSTIGKNVKFLCEKMLDFIGRRFFSYRNEIPQQAPILMVGEFSQMAHLFFTAIKCVPASEREELLKYFYEWKDVTPGNFEELLARLIEVSYDHHDINSAMETVNNFFTVLIAVWNKLSSLEFVGQRRENIVVAEQQVVQTVQAKKSWTLLD